MASKTEEINEIKNALLPVFQSNPVFSATLFGSYAKGNYNEQSDIDIVIDSRGKLLNIHFYGVLDEICERLGKPVDLFELSEIRNPSPLYTTIQEEGIRIYDR
ncbi:MAG: nucleotidyltransferase domain-containing protein [Clostridia bacterium]|nr:nucleotidyltransferase domain-containing protein [Clostridia bacterium]